MLGLIKTSTRLLLAFGVLFASASAMPEAGGFQRFDSLAPQGSHAGRNYGQAIAVEGNLAVIGAPSEKVGSNILQGAVYVYTQSDGRWRQRARLTVADGNHSMRFGVAVAIRAGQILVGAPNATGGGQVYAFDGSGSSWSESQRFRPAGTGSFGYALAVDADRLLVGAPEESGGGAAYIYTRLAGSWGSSVRLIAADRSSGDTFGRAVALDGTRAVVGAPFKGLSSGAVYPYMFDGVSWLAGTAMNASATASGYEGWALALRGDRLLVGVPGEDRAGVNSTGAVLHYRFGAGTWQFQERIDGPLAVFASFGQAIRFDGVHLFIGAPGLDRVWGRRGQVFQAELEPSGFSELTALPDADMAESMGRSLATFAGGLFSGDHFSDVGGVGSDGRVTVLRQAGGSWRVDGVLDAPAVIGTRRFGRVVSISGNRAAVGMPWVDGQRGNVQIFDFDGRRWQWSATISDSVGNDGDRFGSSLVLDADRLIVGAPNRTNSGTSNGGSAVIFAFDGSSWNEVYRYDNSFAANDYLGTAVALDGDRAAIGVPRSDYGGLNDSGMAVVLERSGGTWNDVAYVTGATINERLGGSMVFSGGTLAVGASNAASGTGRVRIYRKIAGNWRQLTAINAPAGSAGFGASLDLRNGLLAIGAPDGDSGTGRVAVYREGTTSFTAETLPAIPVVSLSRVGSAVSIDGGRLMAGGLDGGSSSAGLFVFDRDSGGGWSYTGRIASPDGSALSPDGFGTAISLRRPHLLAGAEWRAVDEGRAFAYIEARSNTLALDSLVPASPVSGQSVVVNGRAGNIAGAATGNIRWQREDGMACVATLAGGSGNCTLPGTPVGARVLAGEYLPDRLPDLPATLAASAYTVVKADSSVSLSATPETAHPGQSIVLNAVVSAVAPGSGLPGGMLDFHAGDPSSTPVLCSVAVSIGSCTATAGSVGSTVYQVRYSGDVNFNPSDSGVSNLNITAWPTTVSLNSPNPLPAKVGQLLSANVSVSADAASGTPTGRVRLLLDGNPGDWVALDGSGQASPQIVPQTHGPQTLSAEFDGQDGNHADSAGGEQPITVVGLSSNVLLTINPDSGVRAGDDITLTATVSLEDASAASGSLSIHAGSSENPPLCTVSAPSGGCSFVPPMTGNHSFVAVYNGDQRAMGSSGHASVSVQGALTQTAISAPVTATVDQPFTVTVWVSSDIHPIEGTVTVSDGESSCQVKLASSSSCQLTPSYLGLRTLHAHYMPEDGVHAASDAEPVSIDIEGIAVTLSLNYPVGEYSVGDSILLTPIAAAGDDGDPSAGILTLRLDDASGSVICAGNPPLAACQLTLPNAGVQHFHLSYSGSPRYAPVESSGFSVPVSALQSIIAVQYTDPATVISDADFVLVVAVTSSNGVPPGTLVVSTSADPGNPLCSGVMPDSGDGLYRCLLTAPSEVGWLSLEVSFESSSNNYTDVSIHHAVQVSSAIRQILLLLDDAVSTFEAGDVLDYTLSLYNQAAGGGDVSLRLEMLSPDGTHGMRWLCEDSSNGAACPQVVWVDGEIGRNLVLPPASHLEFRVIATVDDPAPVAVEALAEAQLSTHEANDDPAALIGIDVNFNANGWLFGNSFEGDSR